MMSKIDERVAVPRWLYDRLLVDAARWREFGQELYCEVPVLGLLAESPYVRDLILGWVEWNRRCQAADASHAISGAVKWTGAGALTYAELRRRRAQLGALAEDARRRRGAYFGGPVDWDTGMPIAPGCGS
ncbi:hypothetical protein [Saccharopolyspora sp. ASAGF58]|uniref:hypothetical protein n=1 Tax=Saccharopolyspora sp. ASAGF58 TaxID=2719023 RepID=UPI001445D7B5|nr:hypothetical protein [Saccharopolyspora sp. ASAGF58]